MKLNEEIENFFLGESEVKVIMGLDSDKSFKKLIFQ